VVQWSSLGDFLVNSAIFVKSAKVSQSSESYSSSRIRRDSTVQKGQPSREFGQWRIKRTASL